MLGGADLGRSGGRRRIRRHRPNVVHHEFGLIEWQATSQYGAHKLRNHRGEDFTEKVLVARDERRAQMGNKVEDERGAVAGIVAVVATTVAARSLLCGGVKQ